MSIDIDFFKDIRKHADRFYIIHYSSQSLFDAESGTLSPRITSVVVQHYKSRQTVSSATHTAAEELGISFSEIEARYDDIERRLLTQFYDFARDRREKFWIHWNMRNVTYGFEHLEHQYRTLTGKEPPSIPVEVRLNLNDILKGRFGEDYAPDPRMPSLMEMNGGRVQGFLSGKEESDAFKAKDFIRMNTSTISKVAFFHHVISLALNGKLKTNGSGIVNFIERVLESRRARIIAFIGMIIGLVTGIVQIAIWVEPSIRTWTHQPSSNNTAAEENQGTASTPTEPPAK